MYFTVVIQRNQRLELDLKVTMVMTNTPTVRDLIHGSRRRNLTCK